MKLNLQTDYALRVLIYVGTNAETLSTIQEMVFEIGGGEKSRAPKAEKEPAPPKISYTGGVGGKKCISSEKC